MSANDQQVAGDHYHPGETFQHWDFAPMISGRSYYLAQITRYLLRPDKSETLKARRQDLAKTRHYLDKLREWDEEVMMKLIEVMGHSVPAQSLEREICLALFDPFAKLTLAGRLLDQLEAQMDPDPSLCPSCGVREGELHQDGCPMLKAEEPPPIERVGNVWCAFLHCHTTGMSDETARGALTPKQMGNHGTAASALAAVTDYHRCPAELYHSTLHASRATDVPWAILLAVASRESRVGAVLSDEGWDSERIAFGAMQLDGRYHTLVEDGPLGRAHVLQAAQLLNRNLIQVHDKHPTWENEWLVRGAIAAYNFGVGNVRTKEHLDVGSTGGDYSSDVVRRAQKMQALLEQAGNEPAGEYVNQD